LQVQARPNRPLLSRREAPLIGFASEHRAIRIIVDLDELRSPPKQQGAANCKGEPDHHLWARGTGPTLTKAPFRPNQCTDPCPHFLHRRRENCLVVESSAYRRLHPFCNSFSESELSFGGLHSSGRYSGAGEEL